MALVPTLLIVGLVTIVVVMFFNLATVQMRTSTSHVATVELASLRDLAVNSVIGQLRQGTTETNALWTSQPGALRTFATDGGAPANVYKLYSARDMVVAASSLTTPAARNLETDVPVDWDTLPDVYANLNEPGIDSTGRVTFPIVDPRAMDQPSPVYPGSRTPEGFRYSGQQAVTKTNINGVVAPGGTPSSQRLPMPVQWMYILADGSLGVIDRVTRTFVPFSGQNPATASNPIVGRAAFWTDDETSKININTASEGIYWDTPRCVTDQEIAFAKQPPTRNEVQRFGGHPATTSLSTVFYPGERLVPGVGDSNAKLEKIYAVAPRVNHKGTSNTSAGIMGGNASAVAFDLDRLYASVDEFLLASPPSTGTLTPGTAYSRSAVQELVQGDPERLDRVRFFLTAESRAPEMTSAGMPRMCLWPVYYDHNSTTHRTSFDNVAGFCTTLGNEIGKIQPFHFRRNSARTNEGEFVNESDFAVDTTKDPWKIGSVGNGNLATYMLAQLKLKKQGYSKTFGEKYDTIYGSPSTKLHNSGTGIMGIMEYVRQTNLHDTSTATGGAKIKAYGEAGSDWIGSEISGQVNSIQMGKYPPAFNSSSNTVLKRGTNQVFTNGIGREYTVSEFGLVFNLAAEHRADGGKFNPDLVDYLELPKGTKAIQASPVFEVFCPGQGYTMVAASSSAQAKLLGNLRLKTDTLGIRKPQGLMVDGKREDAAGYGTHNLSVAHLAYLAGGNPPTATVAKQSTGSWWNGWGGCGGRWLYADNNSSPGASVKTAADLDKPSHDLPNQYSRGYFLIASADKKMTITLDDARTSNIKNTLEIGIGNQRDGDFAGHLLYIKLPTDGIEVPVPEEPALLKPTMGARIIAARASGNKRYTDPTTTEPGVETIDRNDVVRTWVVRHGDYRLCYIRQTEGTSLPDAQRLFTPHPKWDSAKKQIHSFTKSGGGWELDAIRPARSIVAGALYSALYQPDFVIDPTSPTFLANIPTNYPYSVDPSETRDWDNGTGIAPDGAYWNKPDDVAKIWDGSIPPYFQTRNWDGVIIGATNETTAPNQLIPSAVMFGSIPSAGSTGLQWTTYLFRPEITAGGHLGAKDHSTGGNMPGAPPDHAMLDWFWMPVVQPYAISEPFSTAGKINMNYRMVPFTNITRATGLHAVLKSEQLLAIPTLAAATYKLYSEPSPNGGSGPGGARGWRHYIDADKTMLQWEDKFDSGEVFKHASEVCEQFLVPEGEASSASSSSSVRSAMQSFWDSHRLTGDNSLERPYANIYPRLTTRSNTYRIHFLVQTITKARSTEPGKFVKDTDTITGESQGDALVERSIDPNDPALGTSDYNYINAALTGTLSTAKSLDSLYSWRIRHYRKFSR